MSTATKLIAAIAITGASLSMGCAKAPSDAGAAQVGAASFASTALQLPLPNNSYSVSQATDSLPSGTNVTQLAAVVDQVALPLKESIMLLGRTIREGQRAADGLSYTLPSSATALTGVQNDGTKNVAWNYAISTRTHFSGITSISPGTGELMFPSSTYSAAIQARWELSISATKAVNRVTVTHPTRGSLLFTVTFAATSATPTAVELTGRVNSQDVSGKWDAQGGSLTLGTNSPVCWNSQRVDSICPTSR